MVLTFTIIIFCTFAYGHKLLITHDRTGQLVSMQTSKDIYATHINTYLTLHENCYLFTFFGNVHFFNVGTIILDHIVH